MYIIIKNNNLNNILNVISWHYLVECRMLGMPSVLLYQGLACQLGLVLKWRILKTGEIPVRYG
jgi:hypothetical protein